MERAKSIALTCSLNQKVEEAVLNVIHVVENQMFQRLPDILYVAMIWTRDLIVVYN